MAIIISKGGKGAQKVVRSEFENEDYMQKYIHNNPDAIPVYEVKEDKKLFVVKRELETNAGPIDALAVDGDGDLYVIETKLQKNSGRRKVVAQALDYGAALWKHFNDFDLFIEKLDEEAQNNFELSFEEKVQEFFELDDVQLGVFMQTLQINLNDGNLKFVIIMDAMDERLKDLIIYINQNSQFDIYAVQLEYYKHQDFEIMIPKIFGVEVKKNIKTKASNSKKWDEVSFINDVKKYLAGESDKIISLYEYFKNENGVSVGFGNGVTSSFQVRFDKLHKTQALLIVYANNGNIEVKQKRLNEWLQNDDIVKDERFDRAFENLKGVIKDGTTYIPLEELNDKNLNIIKDFVSQCKQIKRN